MYEHILVPVDGSHESEAALGYVELLAAHQPSEVTVFQVADLDLDMADPKHQAFLHRMEAGAQEQARHYVNYVVTVLQEEGVTAHGAVALGRPADLILARVAEDKSDLVVMMSRGRSGLDRFRHGSVAWELRHRLTVPMLVAPAGPHAFTVQPWGAKPVITDILVPLDGSALAEQALPHAQALAAQLDADVHLLRVVTRPAAVAMDPAGIGYYFEIEHELVADAEQYLREKAGELGPAIQTEVRVVRGLPGQSILSYAEQLEHPMVCMTTHGRTGLGRVVLGSVAEKVAQESGVPVFLVRAQGG